MELMQNIGLTLCGAVFLLFVTASYIKSKKKKSYGNLLFIILLVSTILATVSDISFGLFSINVETSASILNILSRVYLFLTILSLNVLTAYILLCSKRDIFEQNKKFKLISLISIILLTIIPFIIINVTGKIITISANDYNIAGVNTTFGKPFILCIIPILLVIIYVFATSLNNIIKEMKLPFFTTIIILIIEILLNIFVEDTINELTLMFQLITTLIFLTSESANVRMINEIQESRQKSEIALDGQNEFISSMSHDIRTPLGAIIGMIEVILHDENLTLEKTKEELTSVIDASEKLTELMTNLIDIASINDNNIKVENSVFTINKLSEKLNNMIINRAASTNTAYSYTVSERMPSTLNGDSDKISRSILLMANAMLIKTENGTINLKYYGEVENDLYKLNVEFELSNTKFTKEDFDIDFGSYMSLYTDKINTIDSEKLGIIISKNYVEMLGGNINYSILENGNGLCKIIFPVQIGKGE